MPRDTATVRNPLLAIPGIQEAIAQVPPEARRALRLILLGLRRDCAAKAHKSWFASKGPMALYWKTTSVYCGHIARLLRD